jgi:hypothetical protein
MGRSQSSAKSGRFFAAFLRMVLERCPRFQSLPTQNELVTLLQGHDFDPTLGMGHICISVDDMLVSDPHYDKTGAAFDWILDCTVRVGLICKPLKIKPPSQIQKNMGSFMIALVCVPSVSPKTNSTGKERILNWSRATNKHTFPGSRCQSLLELCNHLPPLRRRHRSLLHAEPVY